MATGGSLIGALRVTLGLDAAPFVAGTKRARNIAKRDVGEIQKIMGGVKSAFVGLATAATATAFAAAAKRALDYAGGLGELAQQAGVSTRALQEYAAVGVDIGLTNDDVVSSFARLSKALGEAQDGDKRLSDAFRQLGIDVRGLTAEDAMPKLIAAFEKIKSPTDQARLAADLFGRSAGAKMLPLLNMTAEGFERARQQAHEFGMVLSDDAIASADAASDAIARLTKVVETNFAAAMSSGADGTAAMADEIARMVARLPAQIEAIRKFAFAAGQGLRNLNPAGGLIADQALKASTYTLNDKQFIDLQRKAAADLRANPNDPRAMAFAQFVRQQGRDREAQMREQQGQRQATEAGLSPRTERGGGGGGKGGGGGERDRSAEYIERFNRELSGLQDEYLGLQQSITTDVRERARLEHERIDNERQAYLFDVENRVKAGELTEAQAEALRIQYERNATKQNTLVNWQLDDELTAQELDARRAQLDLENEALGRELDNARTQDERRRIQLQILENEMALQRASLEAVIAKHDSTEIEKQIAQARLDQLAKEQAGREAGIRRSTMGPMEQYLDSLPKSAAELNEAYQQVAAEGLQSLNDGIVDAIMNAKSLGDVFKNVSNQIIADLLRIAVQRSITEPLANMLFGGGQGGGLFASIGGLFGGGGGAASAAGGASRLLGLANGGSFMVGGMPGVDRNVLSLNGVPQVRVSANERITVNRPGQAQGAQTVQVVPSPYFDVVVDGRVAKTGGGMMRSQSQSNARRGRQRLA